VADGDLIFQERLSHGWNEVGKANPAVNVRLAFRRPGCNGGNAVGGFSEFKECPETQSFLKRVDVLTLEILDLSLVLKELSTKYTTVESCTMQNRYL
jgi:hypothetical protein